MKRSFDYLTATMAAVALGCLVLLSGCGPQNGDPVAATPPTKTAPARAAAPVPPAPDFHLGEVRHIETLTERPKGTGVGAVAGGVLGGVVGHQIGDGNGQKAATVVGAVGGAVLGNKIERDRAVKVVGYRVEVRMDTGEVRNFQRTQLDGLSVGRRVRVDGDSVKPA
jgi:outer membrane lipoprotein SlyB